MVERVEKLGQLEGVFGQVRRLGRDNGLINDVGSFCRGQP
jgi:hypothetical protein